MTCLAGRCWQTSKWYLKQSVFTDVIMGVVLEFPLLSNHDMSSLLSIRSWSHWHILLSIKHLNCISLSVLKLTCLWLQDCIIAFITTFPTENPKSDTLALKSDFAMIYITRKATVSHVFDLWTVFFCLLTRALNHLYNRAMASPEDVIEPLAESAAAQNLNRRRFSHDCHDLTKDELDGLMSRSGEKRRKWISFKIEAPHWETVFLDCFNFSNRRRTSFHRGASSFRNRR